MTCHIDQEGARRFLLRKQGLLGDYRFVGKEGALAYVRQAGCIQFDPVDCCGKNAELTLQSRVKGFTRPMLAELLYQDRRLMDYPDKMLSVFPVEDWPYFGRYRRLSLENGRRFAGLPPLEQFALDYIAEHGPVSAATLPIEGKIHWHSSIHWSGNWHGESDAARSVLEQLYTDGRLVIHHKQGARKFYDLAARHIDARLLEAPEPLPDGMEYTKWRVLRRIGAVGLLWNRNSGAYLGIEGLNAETRSRAFQQLLDESRLEELRVSGLGTSLYFLAEDRPLLEQAANGESWKPRCEFLAPLDPLLWDRELIRRLFGFDYSWEIYTPSSKRKYGYYVLPVLYGGRFVGRIEALRDEKRGLLCLQGLWWEPGLRITRKLEAAVAGAIRRLARFNGCQAIEPEPQAFVARP